MDIDVTLHTIWSGSKRSFMNNMGIPNGLCLWGHCLSTPTFLVTNGDYWHIALFDDEAHVNRGMASVLTAHRNPRVYKLPGMEEVDITGWRKQEKT